MPENRLPRRLLYGELSSGQRSVGRPKKRFIDHIKMNLRKCHIKPCDLETLTSDRVVYIALPPRNVEPRVIRPQQNQRQVHSVLTAAEPVPPSLDCRVTCVHIDPSTAQLSSSATSSSTSTDFSSRSSNQ